MLQPEQITRLTETFRSARYLVDDVIDRLGEDGQEGLLRNSTIPALDVLGDSDDAQAMLIRLFPLQQNVDRAALQEFIDVETLESAGIIERVKVPSQGAFPGAQSATKRGADLVRAVVDIRPYGFEDSQGEWSGWVAADPTPGLDKHVEPMRPDYVLGVSPASTSLAQLTVPDQVEHALDLGTGCAVQSLHLARHARSVVATDINPRAVELARLTLALNEVDASVVEGSLYEPVDDKQFDLIVTNPPYVMSPPTRVGERLVYREAGFSGDGLVRSVVTGAPGHLRDGGLLQVLANWADTHDKPWQDRLSEWVQGTGCDLWVVQREYLDIYSYIEMWLTDAGLAGDPAWGQRYREWLDYFTALGIKGVGMGWIMLHKTGSSHPDIHIEEWPYQIAQPVGPALSAGLSARRLAHMPDHELIAGHYLLDPDVIQETMGQPGASDPNHIVLRQNTGLKRAMEVDTALGGVLGACDGDLSMGQIIGAVGQLLGEPTEQLQSRLLPQIRQALQDGIITPR